MKGLQFTPETKELNLKEDLPIPKINSSRDVLVKTAYCGICGTDVHIIKGEFPCRPGGPITLGHEISGIVHEIGKDVKSVKVGDKIAIEPSRGCDLCDSCRDAKPHYCKQGGLNVYTGIWKNGGWAEYVLVPEFQIYKIPTHLTLKQGALMEPLSCISHSWDRMCPVPLGKRIMVLGSGIIGILFSCILYTTGQKNVTVVEPHDGRRKLIENLKFGFGIITPTELDARKQKNPDLAFDMVIDTAGNVKAFENAFKLLDMGGKLYVFACANQEATVSLSPFQMFAKETTIAGTLINPFSYPRTVNLMTAIGNRYIDYNALGVKTFPLTEYKSALEALQKGLVSKATFDHGIDKGSQPTCPTQRPKIKCCKIYSET